MFNTFGSFLPRGAVAAGCPRSVRTRALLVVAGLLPIAVLALAAALTLPSAAEACSNGCSPGYAVQPDPANLKVVVNSQGTGATFTWEQGTLPPSTRVCNIESHDVYLYSTPGRKLIRQAGMWRSTASKQSYTLTGLTSGKSYSVTAFGYCRRWQTASIDFTARPGAIFPPPSTATPTATPEPTPTATPAPTATPTPTPTATPEPTPTATPEPTPAEDSSCDTPGSCKTYQPDRTQPVPANLKVVVNSDGTGATFTWEQGTLDSFGRSIAHFCDITAHQVRLTSPDTKGWATVLGQWNSNARAQSYQLTGLTPGAQYSVEAHGYCERWTSKTLTFTATPGTTFPAQPELKQPPPVQNIAVATSGATATITWDAPAAAGAGVCAPASKEQYRYTLRNRNLSGEKRNQNVEDHVRVIVSERKIILNDLTPGDKYWIIIKTYSSDCERWGGGKVARATWKQR